MSLQFFTAKLYRGSRLRGSEQKRLRSMEARAGKNRGQEAPWRKIVFGLNVLHTPQRHWNAQSRGDRGKGIADIFETLKHLCTTCDSYKERAAFLTSWSQ